VWEGGEVLIWLERCEYRNGITTTAGYGRGEKDAMQVTSRSVTNPNPNLNPAHLASSSLPPIEKRTP
jgi:hypothetical protein